MENVGWIPQGRVEETSPGHYNTESWPLTPIPKHALGHVLFSIPVVFPVNPSVPLKFTLMLPQNSALCLRDAGDMRYS
ncbi:uncharacterized protein VSU04_002206 isoform 2-T2 [Chlamydotis macqueenii]